jgi:hypothetical protein
MTLYQKARQHQAELDKACELLGERLALYPRNEMGLTPDAVKASLEWKADKAAFNKAFQALRNFNSVFVKTFAKEMRAERRARRAA